MSNLDKLQLLIDSSNKDWKGFYKSFKEIMDQKHVSGMQMTRGKDFIERNKMAWSSISEEGEAKAALKDLKDYVLETKHTSHNNHRHHHAAENSAKTAAPSYPAPTPPQNKCNDDVDANQQAASDTSHTAPLQKKEDAVKIGEGLKYSTAMSTIRSLCSKRNVAIVIGCAVIGAVIYNRASITSMLNTLKDNLGDLAGLGR